MKATSKSNYTEDTGHFFAEDGTKICFTHWKGSVGNGKVVCLIHGIGYYGKAYKKVAERLCPRGYEIYAMDLRGHGDSDGGRGSLPSKKTLLSDVRSFIRLVAYRHTGSKVYLLGESMGGLISLSYLADNKNDHLSGLILVAPAVSLKPRFYLSSDLLKFPFFSWFFPDRNFMSLTNWRLDRCCSPTSDFATSVRNDPKFNRRINSKYVSTIIRLRIGLLIKLRISNWRNRSLAGITLPTAILQGKADRLLSYRGAEKLFRLIASEDKFKHILVDSEHALFWDKRTPEVLDRLDRWLDEH
jgi:alpha-beta hydrolase superfamily lysophospholipase